MNPDIFKAYDIRGKVGTELNYDTCERVGKALGDWLPSEGSVAVGYDMRPDSQELAKGVMAGLQQQGRDVVNIGLVSTDMIYFAVGNLGLAGGAMVTASHNPGEYNGIKLCRDGATPIGLDAGLSDIRDAAMANDFAPAMQKGSVIEQDIREDWVQHLLSFVDVSSLKPFTIAVDAGNGMAGAILPILEKYLPCTFVPLYWELDGTFPHHEANPMKEETLADVSKIVQERPDIDFGMAFDGDGDRVALIDEAGRPVSGSMTFALLAARALKAEPGAPIVHDLRMSRSTLEFIEKNGGTCVRSKVGNPSVKRLMVQQNAPLGGETTGHFVWRDNYFIDSGMLAAVLALAELSESGNSLQGFVSSISNYYAIPETNYTVADKEAVLKQLTEAFADGTADWLDGLTVNFGDAWLSVRASNTEPLLRLNIEAKDRATLQKLLDRAEKTLK